MQDTVKNDFFNYLSNLGISRKSHKNYRSDLSSFLSWITEKYNRLGIYIAFLGDTLPFLTADTVSQYKAYLILSHIPIKTVNRRLSTLRHLSKFLYDTGLLSFNLTGGIENIRAKPPKSEGRQVLQSFRRHLESEKVSANTVKNYLSDINQFFNWLEAKQKQI